MNNKFIPIYYDGFWDIPLAFLTIYNNELFFFDRGGFDYELDDYPTHYKVYLIKNMKLEDSFEVREAETEAIKLLNIPLLLENPLFGSISVGNIIFDKTKRKFVNTSLFNIIQPPKRTRLDSQ